MMSAADKRRELNARLAGAHAKLDLQRRRLQAARAQFEATMMRLRNNQPEYEQIRASACGRLQARLDTMTVIEQAKGILMARCRCGSDEAFILLVGAAQRADVRVGALAARIVEEAADVGPLSLPGTRRASKPTLANTRPEGRSGQMPLSDAPAVEHRRVLRDRVHRE